LNINKELSCLTVEDSILSSSLFKRIFNSKKPILPLCDRIEKKFLNELAHIHSIIEFWVDSAPNDWNIDKKEWILHCKQFWLTEKWLKKSIRNFHEIIEIEF
jgi:hypothetical protein